MNSNWKFNKPIGLTQVQQETVGMDLVQLFKWLEMGDSEETIAVAHWWLNVLLSGNVNLINAIACG